MNVLAIDVGGTHVKILASGQTDVRKFASGPTMTPVQMVAGVKQLAAEWKYDVVSIGYPGIIRSGNIVSEPHNLAPGWVGYDFQTAFGCPIKLLNDAAMQALGSYQGGLLLFLGLGTGLGSALIVQGQVVPLELAHLPYRKATYEDYLGIRGLDHYGKKRWREHVATVVELFINAFHPDDVVLGGGNVKKLQNLPPGCRAGDNSHAFEGGFRLWEKPKNEK